MTLCSNQAHYDQSFHFQCRTPCPICGKKYSDLRQHIRLVHEGHKVNIIFMLNKLIVNIGNSFLVLRKLCFSWSVRNVVRSTQI